MITTRLTHIPTTGFNYEVCHLFEHLVIGSFFSSLEEAGHNPTLFGWLNGRTFDGHVFFDAGFYDPDCALAFDKFIMNLPEWDLATIKRYLKAVGCETKENYSIEATDQLLAQLHRLREATAADIQASEDDAASPFTIKKSASEYKEILVTFGLPSGNLDHSTLFLRLLVILTDIIHYSLRTNLTCYPVSDLSEIVEKPEGLAVAQKWRVEKQVSTKRLQEIIGSALTHFDVNSNLPELNKHFDAFAHEQWLRTLPIDYYERSGIITTNEAISKLANADNIQAILDNVELKVLSWKNTYKVFFN
jgi:hypothetical protein